MTSLNSALSKVVVSLALASAASLAAAAYPDRPVRIVVPFPPGGLSDTLARIVTMHMSEQLKQPFVIDFKAGAATIVGAESVRAAPADGYTLLLGSATTFVINPLIYRKLPYSAEASFEPIGIIGNNKAALLTNAALPIKTVADAVAYAKKDSASYGSNGTGSSVNFVGELLWNAAHVKVLHVPYKGSAPAMTDLMGGQIPFSFDSVPAAIAAAKGGKVRILATSGLTRSPLLPDVPTMIESGYPTVSMESWWAFVAPKGIPAEVRATLEKALANAMADKGVQAKLTATGFDPKYGPPRQYLELVKEDTAKFGPIARANNIQAE